MTPLPSPRAPAPARAPAHALALCLALALAPSPAPAFELQRAADGQPVRWTAFPLQLRLTAPPALLRTLGPFDPASAAQAALATWESVDTSLASLRWAGERAPSAGSPPARGEVVVTFSTSGFASDPGAVARTQLTFDQADPHQIAAASVQLNARDFAWTTTGADGAIDLQSVLLHELGHALGLAHPCGDANTRTPSCTGLPLVVQQQMQASAMWLSAQPGARRTLSADDRLGLAAIAPAPLPTPAPLLEGASPACATTTSGLTLLLTSPRPAGADRLALQLDGATVAEAILSASATPSGQLSATFAGPGSPTGTDAATSSTVPQSARLDLLLSAGPSGKSALLAGGLRIQADCSRSPGCSSAGGGLAPLLGLAAWFGRALAARRRRRSGAGRARRLELACQRGIARPTGLLAAGLLALAPLPAEAFVRSRVNNKDATSPWVWWSTRGHTFLIDASVNGSVAGDVSSGAFEAIRRSFLTWSAVSCSDLVFPDLGLSLRPADRRVGYVDGGFNRNLVLFRTAHCSKVVPAGDPCLTQGGCGNTYDCWDANRAAGVIATTTTSAKKNTGQILDTDIEFNDAPDPDDGSKITFTTVDSPPCAPPDLVADCVAMDIQNTATHEIGHTLGLGHTSVPSATMYATAPEGEVSKRVLHQDDVDGVCSIYPKGAQTVTSLADPGGISLVSTGASDGRGCSASGTGTWLQAAIGLLALAARRRNRRFRRATDSA